MRNFDLTYANALKGERKMRWKQWHSWPCFCRTDLDGDYERFCDHYLHNRISNRRLFSKTQVLYLTDRIPQMDSLKFFKVMLVSNRVCVFEFVNTFGEDLSCQLTSILQDARRYDYYWHSSNFGFPSHYAINCGQIWDYIIAHTQSSVYFPDVIRNIMIQCGDVELNPGPVCSRPVAQIGIEINMNHHIPELQKFLDSPIFQKMTNLAMNFSDDVVERIKTRIVAISTVIYNLTRWSMSKLTTTDLIVNLTSCLAICVPISTMSEFFKHVFSVSAQSGSVTQIRLLLKAFFLSLFVLIVGKLPGKHTVDEFVNRVHKFPQAFESITKFWSQIDPITNIATDFIESDILGYDVIREKNVMAEVEEWAKLVEQYSDLYKKREIAKDKQTMLTAGRIHVDGVRLLSKCLRLHYSRENVELVRSLLPTTYKISEIAIRSGADHSKPRREPLIIWFCGRSGVGKSTLTYPFLCDMMKSELGPEEELPENWVQKIYARAPECEFFDGDPTDWMVYDDGFQIRDSVANPSPELFEIIRLGNMFPYMYHKASIEEKGNCFADVKGIVISSNIERIMAESIHCPEAVARRIRYAYKVQLKPEYRLYYKGKDGNTTYKLDKTMINEPTLDIYQFVPFDPLSGEESTDILCYQEMLMQCAMALNRLGEEFVSYEHWLERYRKVSFLQTVTGKPPPQPQAQQGNDDIEDFFMDLPCRTSGRQYTDSRTFVRSALEKLKLQKCLSRQEVMTLQWLFGSDRQMLRFADLLQNYDVAFLKSVFENPPLELFSSKVSDIELDAFYEELYEHGFLAHTKKQVIDGKEVSVNRVVLDKSCELIPKFHGFAWDDLVFQELATTAWTRKFEPQVLWCKILNRWKTDFNVLRTDPIRSSAMTIYNGVRSLVVSPFVLNQAISALTSIGHEKCGFIPKVDPFSCVEDVRVGRARLPLKRYLDKYERWAKDQVDRKVRFPDAEYVLRTSLPYVQSGPVIEELVEEDVSRVRSAIQHYRMRVKKTAKDAWAYTCANWPNMLLYTVGFISTTYSFYRLYKNVSGDEEEHPQCSAQSLDESGSKTQPRPRARVQHEDVSSGPHANRQHRPRVQNLDESGTSVKHRVSRPRVQAQELNVEIETIKPMAQGNTSSAIDYQLYSVLDSKVAANTLFAYISKPGIDEPHKRLGHVIALRGRLFVMNYHFTMALEEYSGYHVIFRQGNNVFYRCATEELLENFIRVRERDLVVFELKYKGSNAFGDLVKHIQQKSMTYSHAVQTVVLAKHRLNGFSVQPNFLMSTDAHLSTTPVSIEVDLRGSVQEIVNAETWYYTGVTSCGDCGALLLLSNNRVPSKIVGMHNAFDAYRCKAMAVPLYRDEIEEAMAYFAPKAQYGWRDDLPIVVEALKFDHGENFKVVRCEPGTIPTSSKTRLAKSPLFEKLIPTSTKPGYLRPFVNQDGVTVDPGKLARAKWGYHLPVQDKGLAARVTNAVVQVFLKEHRIGSDRYRYPMTTEEAIVGIDGIEGLNSINKVSSPGYPYVFSKIPGRGKTGYFGEYEFDLTLPGARQIIHEVEQMEYDIINNVRPFVVWIDTLKDARIPIQKAERGKTRIFSAGPMAYTILYRKYFLPPIAHTMWNRIDNHIAVGINPTSPEWHTLALKLKSKGKHCIAGDYACFDGKAPTEGYLSALEFFKAWYIQNWDFVVENKCNIIQNYELSQREFSEFLDKIFLEVVNHIHLTEYEIDGVKHHLFYSVCNGQPSGNPGTAMVNSAQGLWMALRCWLELTQGTAYCTVPAFFDHVYMIDYGDDVAMNVSSEAISFYNQNTLTRVMKRLFDIDFTDEKKTGDAVPDSRSLSEITFLKRGFVFNDDIQMYVSPMEVDTLLDILNWVRTGSEDARVITINNIASVAAELALVSKEAFDEWLPRLRQAYSELSWRVNKQIYFDTRYGYLLAFRNAQFKSVDAI